MKLSTLALLPTQRAHSEAVAHATLAATEHQRGLLTVADEAAYKEGLRWQGRLAAAQVCGLVGGVAHALECVRMASCVCG